MHLHTNNHPLDICSGHQCRAVGILRVFSKNCKIISQYHLIMVQLIITKNYLCFKTFMSTVCAIIMFFIYIALLPVSVVVPVWVTGLSFGVALIPLLLLTLSVLGFLVIRKKYYR